MQNLKFFGLVSKNKIKFSFHVIERKIIANIWGHFRITLAGLHIKRVWGLAHKQLTTIGVLQVLPIISTLHHLMKRVLRVMLVYCYLFSP